jgi:hypothetical protein
MSTDYRLFLREEPALDEYVGRDGLAGDATRGYVLDGLRVWAEPYAATDDDALAGHPWRREIRWVVGASGHLDGERWDDFHALMQAVGERYRGALWSATDDEVCWFAWDRDALAADAAAWDGRELARWIADERGEAGARRYCGFLAEGPYGQVLRIALERLPTFTVRATRQAIVLALWAAEDEYEEELRELVGDALLATDATGNLDLAAAQEALEDERDARADEALPLPKTREALADLYDRATAGDKSAQRVLLRGLDEYDGNAFVRRIFGAVLLDRARAGAPRPVWMEDDIDYAWPQLDAAPERVNLGAREAFARRGPLADALTQFWTEREMYAAMLRDTLERRRRAGELFAGIPDDIRAIAQRGEYEGAIEEYARRYDQPLERARQVVAYSL